MPALHDGHRDPHGDLPPRRPGDAGRVRPGRHRVPHLLELRGALARRGVQPLARRGRRSASRPIPNRWTASLRIRRGARATEWIRRRVGAKGYLSHMGTLLGSAIASRDFVAIHMTWGAVNELTTLTAYHRMIAKTENEPLIHVLQAIIKQERRHFAFYRAQAKVRLAGSRRARRIVRWSMDHLWAPVGTGVRPQEETDFLVHVPVQRRRGVVALKEMDGTIAELPGLGGTHYLSEAAERCAERLGVTVRPVTDYRRSRGRTLVPSGVSITSRPIASSRSRSWSAAAKSFAARAASRSAMSAAHLVGRLPGARGLALQIETQDVVPRRRGARTSRRRARRSWRSSSFTITTAEGRSRSVDERLAEPRIELLRRLTQLGRRRRPRPPCGAGAA